jgi:hypothetical protein
MADDLPPDSDAVAEAAEIAWRRLYDRWLSTHDRSPASVRELARAEFRAGDRHRAAVEAARAAGRVWIGPDEVPVDQR